MICRDLFPRPSRDGLGQLLQVEYLYIANDTAACMWRSIHWPRRYNLHWWVAPISSRSLPESYATITARRRALHIRWMGTDARLADRSEFVTT